MKRSLIALVACCVVLCSSMVSAQKYTTLRSKNKDIASGDAKKIKSYSSKVKSLLSGKAPLDAEGSKYLTYFYRDYICYGLTNLKNGGEFGKWRIEIQKNLAGARSKQARNQAVSIIAKYAGGIAKSPKFHPMSRFNAVLLLSDLNQSEGNRSTKPATPPVPYKKVYDTLVKYLDPRVPEEIQMASLIGLMRHAELGTHPDQRTPLPAADQKLLADAALKILMQKEPAKGRSADGHEWMRRRSADVLGRLGAIGPDGAVATTLFETMLAADTSMGIRCACAEALGRMDLSKSKLSSDKMAAGLGKLAADCSAEEVELIVALLKENRGPGGFREGGDGYGSRRGDLADDSGEIQFDDETTLPTRRRLLRRLNQVLFALGEGNAPDGKGILSFADGSSSAENVVEDINQLVEHLKEPESTLRELGVALRDDGSALADRVGDVAVAPVAPAGA